MREEAQWATGGDGSVLLPQRSRGSIARSGEDFTAGFMLHGIECGKRLLFHVDLTAYLEHLGMS